MYQRKIAMVYYIAAKMQRPIDYRKAQRIAERFSMCELTRIFKAAGRRTHVSTLRAG
jgi:hypothetical protein